MHTTLKMTIAGFTVLVATLMAFSADPPQQQTKAAFQITEAEVEAMLTKAYESLDTEVWSFYFDGFSKKEVALVTKLLQSEDDTRWAKIVMDDKVIGTGRSKQFSRTVGMLSYFSVLNNRFTTERQPATEQYGMPAHNGADEKWLTDRGVELDDIVRLYGKPK